MANKFHLFKEIFEQKQYNKIDIPSIMKLLGDDLSDKEIIDYGCGSGFLTRKMAMKAKRVVGVDVSDSMIQLANKSKQDLKNLEYHIADCQKELALGLFDIVFSSYFLIYAQNENMLYQFIKSMYESLKSNGICCGVTNNYDLAKNCYQKLYKYGYEIIGSEKEGDIHIRRFYSDDVRNSEFLFEARSFHMNQKTVQKVFEQVGFTQFKWIPFSLSPEYQHMKNHFDDFLKYSPGIMYWAIK